MNIGDKVKLSFKARKQMCSGLAYERCHLKMIIDCVGIIETFYTEDRTYFFVRWNKSGGRYCYYEHELVLAAKE